MNLRSLWPFGRKNQTLELFREIYGARTSTATGKKVDLNTAIAVSTVLRCTAVISDGISSVPLRLYQKQAKSRKPATDHPLYNLFAYRPNRSIDSFIFREAVMFNVLLTGNAYIYKGRVGRDKKVAELLLLDNGRMKVERLKDWSYKYTYCPINGQDEVIAPENIWHLRGPSFNTVTGIDAIANAREAIGLSMALEESHASLHKNGVVSTGVYTVEGNLDETQYKRLRKYIEDNQAGSSKSGSVFILDRGAKWQALTMSGVDAQHLETRKFQIEEICRFFGVMPIMVGYSDKAATYASAEQMFLAHNVHTLRPWHRRIEQSLMMSFLSLDEIEQGYYFKFTDTEMLRGASKDRADYYMKGIQAGWLTRNEAREFEDMDPIDGLDEPLSPANMVTGNPAEAADPNEPADPNADPNADPAADPAKPPKNGA